MSKYNSIANPFLIGIFVITGSLIMIALIIWLGASQILKEQTYYVTYFDGSVEGLEVGSAVKYQGVPCGRIKNILVAPDSMLVEVVFQIDKSIKINDSLRVQPAMSGIAGGKFLQLHYPTNPEMANKYPTLTFSPPYYIIRSAPSGLEEMTIAAQKVMNNLMELNVYELNRKTMNFLTASTDFFQKKELQSILKDLAQSAAHLNSVMAKTDSSTALNNLDETTYIMKKSAMRIDEVIAELNSQIEEMQLPKYMDRVYLRYDSSMTKTTDIIGKVGFRAEASIFSLQELIEEIVKTNRHLQNTLRSFNDNPSSMFLSSPPPPEK